ncbi:MAG: hypothetical protein Q9M94_00885 [Candidatus Gracilibacteria bacterium]|nr:hypothetical protein [Candidatus Gracilibacteria bacterium]MDQ7022421.1 hypothetical protein [Candidatus Gracilibacteria bacterium]
MNIEEKYKIEREKIRLKYGEIFKSIYDEIKMERFKYMKSKNQIMEKYDDFENPELLLENI